MRYGLVFCLSLIGSYATAQTFCQDVWGASIVGRDGEFLGVVSSQYDANSIFNPYGDFGSEYSSNSIRNKYSDYGSPYSDISAFNDYADNPPMLIIGGQIVALVTTNNYLQGAVNPYAIFSCKQ